MPELIAHLFGDYVLQNHWMAAKKTGSWYVALLHAFLYTLPFLFITQSFPALGMIFSTHAVIDRYRLAKYWTRFWGVGEPGWVATHLEYLIRGTYKIGVPGIDYSKTGVLNSWLPEAAPPWLGVWLLILVDNTFHLLLNRLAIANL